MPGIPKLPIISPFFRRGGGGWSPSQYGTVVFFHDYNRGQTTSSGAISQWNDLSGNGRHWVQGTANARPLLVNGAAQFDGSNDFLEIAGFTNPASYTFFLFVKMTDNGSNVFQLTNGSPGEENVAMDIRLNLHLDSDIATSIGNGTDYSRVSTKINASVTGMYNVYAVSYQNGDTAPKIYVNGELQEVAIDSAAGSQANITGTLSVGGLTGSDFVKMQLLGDLCYSEVLSAEDILTISDRFLDLKSYTELGTIHETDFTSGSEFNVYWTTTGTATPGAGGLVLSDAVFNVYLNDSVSSRERWRVDFSILLGAIDTSSDGPMFGGVLDGRSWRSILYFTSGNAYDAKVYHYNNGNDMTISTETLDFSEGDTITGYVERRNNVLISVYENTTPGPNFGSKVWWSTYANFTSVDGRLPNTSCHFGMFQTGGAHTIKYFKLSSANAQDCKYVFFGDSITVGYNQVTVGQRFTNIAVDNPNQLVACGGSSETTTVMLGRMDEVLLINPEKVIIMASVNDVGTGVPINTSFSNLTTMKNTFENAGIEVIFCKLTPANSFDVNPYNDRLDTDFGMTNTIIDMYTILKDPMGTGIDAAYSADGLHPNAAAAILMAGELNAAGIN